MSLLLAISSAACAQHPALSADAWCYAAGIGPSDGEGGGSLWLKRAFSMLDREDLEVDLSKLDSMAKVGLGWMTGLRCRPSACDLLQAAASCQGGRPPGCMVGCGSTACLLPGTMAACAAAALPAGGGNCQRGRIC